MLNGILMFLLFFTALFLILLVLVQRGRGGGLAGAFGGMGGQSAFGTKAGDLFTRITIGVATFWIILCAASVKLLSENSRNVINVGGPTAPASSGASGKAPVGQSKGSASGTGKSASDSAAPAKTPAPSAGGAAEKAAAPAADSGGEKAK